jgi:xanthine dehydrogenase molybdenum-binding subunit
VKLTINHLPYDIESVPGETLADLLRKRLNLTGTKIGCEEAECGACTVLVDDEAVLSCVYPAERAAGKTVLTIEGLSSSEGLHPLQQAFIEHGAVQCGFCTPGLIMTAYALLRRNPDPSEDDIRHALKDTLCRCGGYPSILRAIHSAAHHLRTGESLPPPLTLKEEGENTGNLGVLGSVGAGECEDGHRRAKTARRPEHASGSDLTGLNRSIIGSLQPRPDAAAKVTGAAQFTDDLSFNGMLFAAVRRAGVPHAFLRRLDLDEARRLPGVVVVLSALDLPGAKKHGLVIPDWPVLVGVGERVRYVGDALAIVAAETQETAEQAAALIETEFDLQPVVSGPVQARQPGAPQLHPDGNLLKHIKVRKGNIEQGFAEAEVILEHTFHTASTDHMFLEPECSIAVPTLDGRMEIYVGSQIPYSDRAQVAAALGWPEDRVRVIGQLVGGGFGGKEDIAGQIHAALLANAAGRAVKLSFDRHESLLVHPKRHATQIRVKIGARRDGRLTAVETELYGDTGAYASLGDKVLTRATTHSAGPYEVAHVKADCYAMYTNNPPAGAFRGFGVTQSAFAIESMMDMLAEGLCLDPLALRRMNAMRVGSVTNTGQVLHESVGLVECIDRVEAEVRKMSSYPPQGENGRSPLSPNPFPQIGEGVRG